MEIDDPDDPNISGFLNSLIDHTRAYFSTFSLAGGRGEIYQKAYSESSANTKESEDAQETVKKIEMVDAVLNKEITPYISVAVGKESAEGYLMSPWGGLTYITNGVSGSTTNVRIPVINNTPTSTFPLGVTFTNSPLWVSGNVGYMFPLLTKYYEKRDN